MGEAGAGLSYPDSADDEPRPGMDMIGWYIATLHQTLGHDKTAMVIGQPAGDREACLLCKYERAPDAVKRQAVIDALAPAREG